MPGTVLGFRDMAIKTDKLLRRVESTLQWEKTVTGKKGNISSFSFHMLSLKRYKVLTIEGK